MLALVDEVLAGLRLPIAKALDPNDPGDFDKIVDALARATRGLTGKEEALALAKALKVLDVDWKNLDAGARAKVLSAGKAAVNPVKRVQPQLEVLFQVNAEKLAEQSKASSNKKFGLNIKPNLDKTDKRVVKAIGKSQGNYVRDEYGKRSEKFSKQAKTIVEKGLKKGWGRDEIREELKKKLVSFNRSDAYWNVIAASFANRSRTYGNLSGYQAAGITRFTFQAVRDERTSTICRLMHGKSFEVADALAAYQRTEDAENPEDIRHVQPWVREGKNAKGQEQLFYNDAKGNRFVVANVKDSARGKVDQSGSYGKVMSDKKLAASGIMTPPLHGNCRSTIIPDTSIEIRNAPPKPPEPEPTAPPKPPKPEPKPDDFLNQPPPGPDEKPINLPPPPGVVKPPPPAPPPAEPAPEREHQTFPVPADAGPWRQHAIRNLNEMSMPEYGSSKRLVDVGDLGFKVAKPDRQGLHPESAKVAEARQNLGADVVAAAGKAERFRSDKLKLLGEYGSKAPITRDEIRAAIDTHVLGPLPGDVKLPTVYRLDGKLFVMPEDRAGLAAAKLRASGADLKGKADLQLNVIDLDALGFGKKPPAPTADNPKHEAKTVGELVSNLQGGFKAIDKNAKRGNLSEQAAYDRGAAQVRGSLRSFISNQVGGAESRDVSEARKNRDKYQVAPKARMGNAAGMHSWSGEMIMRKDYHDNLKQAFGKLSASNRAMLQNWDLQAVRTLVHEELHGFSPMPSANYRGVGIFIEECQTEILARKVVRDMVGRKDRVDDAQRAVFALPRVTRYTGPDGKPAVVANGGSGSYPNFIKRLMEDVGRHTTLPEDVIAERVEGAFAANLKAKTFKTPEAQVDAFVDNMKLPKGEATKLKLALRSTGKEVVDKEEY